MSDPNVELLQEMIRSERRKAAIAHEEILVLRGHLGGALGRLNALVEYFPDGDQALLLCGELSLAVDSWLRTAEGEARRNYADKYETRDPGSHAGSIASRVQSPESGSRFLDPRPSPESDDAVGRGGRGSAFEEGAE